MKVAVAGATGVVGRHVVSQARERGHDVVMLSRAHGVDLTSGAGLAGRLAGVGAVVDVTGTRAQRRRPAREFFDTVTSTLLQAEQRADVGHHLVLSIVGVGLIHLGYYAAKLAQEELVAAGPVPWTVLRTTQFHEFAEQSLSFSAVGPVSFVPTMRTQPVAATEVAATVVDLIEAGPAGRTTDLAGPERHNLVDLARRVAEARRPGRRVVGVPLPGRTGAAMRQGALLPPSDARRGRTTFQDWLDRLPS